MPIVLLVIYSFNESQLVTVWGGFSTKWYAALLHDEQHARRRLGDDPRRAPLRYRRHRARHDGGGGARAPRPLPGRTLFSGMIYAPLVMPEVITGLSLLLLFVAHRLRPRLLDRDAGAYHLHHVLRRGRGAVAPRHLRPDASRRRRWTSAARR